MGIFIGVNFLDPGLISHKLLLYEFLLLKEKRGGGGGGRGMIIQQGESSDRKNHFFMSRPIGRPGVTHLPIGKIHSGLCE